jgi:hypothetical protein
VAITGRRIELGQRVAAEIRSSRGEAIFIAADVARAEDCRRSIDEAIIAMDASTFSSITQALSRKGPWKRPAKKSGCGRSM